MQHGKLIVSIAINATMQCVASWVIVHPGVWKLVQISHLIAILYQVSDSPSKPVCKTGNCISKNLLVTVQCVVGS